MAICTQLAGFVSGVFRGAAHGIGIFVFVEKRRAHRAQESAERAEHIVHGAGFIAAMDHAVRALGIAAFGAVAVPVSFADQFLKCVGVAVLQKVAGLLPAENVVGGHAPRGAFVIALAHQEFHEQGAEVEAPAFAAVAQNLAEKFARLFPAEEMFLVGSLIVGVTGREHHALDAQVHHIVEKMANALRVGAVEERGVGGYAEATLQGQLDRFDGFVVSAFAANGEIVFFALAIHVNREGQIFAGGEEVQLFFQEQRVGAEVDVLLARDQSVHDFGDLGMHQRLAAGDADHRRATFINGAKTFLGA